MRFLESLASSCLILGCLLSGCGGNSSVSDCFGTNDGGIGNSLDASPSATATGGAPSTSSSAFAGCREIRDSLGCGFAMGPRYASPVELLLVVERSSAMGEPHPVGNGLSKWNTMLWSLSAVLTRVNEQRAGDDAEFKLGLELFPYPAALAASDLTLDCTVPSGNDALAVKMGPATAQLPEIYDSLGAQVTSGFTPTAVALRRAYDYYTSGDELALASRKWVLLVTSGAGNCNATLSCGADQCARPSNSTCANTQSCCGGTGCADDTSVLSAISDLASAGIRTLVLSPTPSSVLAWASLNAYAEAGRYPNSNSAGGELFYSITNALANEDLVQALETFLPQVVKTCDIELRDSIPDASRIRLFADCQEIYPASADAGDGGWLLDSSQSPPHLKILGSSCTNILTYGVKELDVLQGCTGVAQ